MEDSPEIVQNKIYSTLEELKEMHSNLPAKDQMLISYELLSELASALVMNDTTFEIVKGLMEIQQFTEKHLFTIRSNTFEKYGLEIKNVLDSNDQSNLEKIKKISLIKIKQRDELKELDLRTIIDLDEKRKDQQTFLEKAGVPGFFVTTDKKKIRAQMYLIDFILRIWSQLNSNSSFS